MLCDADLGRLTPELDTQRWPALKSSKMQQGSRCSQWQEFIYQGRCLQRWGQPPGFGHSSDAYHMTVSCEEKLCHADGGKTTPELDKEALASIEKLKRAAEKQPLPMAQSDAPKQTPAALKAPIKAFAVAVMRQSQKHKPALKIALDAVMPVMEPYTSRHNFTVRSSLSSHIASAYPLPDIPQMIDFHVLDMPSPHTVLARVICDMPRVGSKTHRCPQWSIHLSRTTWRQPTTLSVEVCASDCRQGSELSGKRQLWLWTEL